MSIPLLKVCVTEGRAQPSSDWLLELQQVREQALPTRGLTGLPVRALFHRRHGLGAHAFGITLLSLSVAFTLIGASSALAISRDTVLARAQGWVDKPVAYSQSKYHAGYRTDCSGYVSMCWGTGTSWSTSTFFAVTHKIRVSQLKPGDAMLKRGSHVRLFYAWADDAHTSYITYESGYGSVAVCRIHDLAADLADGYVPARYDRISDSATPNNVLRNRSFDAWLKPWNRPPEQPLWWTVRGFGLPTLATHRKDIYRTARNSLQLVNPNDGIDDTSGEITELSQVATITQGVPYLLTAWAQTPSNPANLELGVAYLDASGQSIVASKTTGEAWGVSNSAFRRMSVKLTAPANATRALVTVRLAGGTTTDTVGGVTNGTSAILDDIALARPQATISIKPNATKFRRGRSVVLKGSIAPAAAVGVRTAVYVQRPGSGWKRLTSATARASGSTATWRSAYYFAKRARRGTYRFRTVVPAIPGYLGATSSIVSVKLK